MPPRFVFRLIWDTLNALLLRYGLAGALVAIGRICFLVLIATVGHFVTSADFGLFMVVLAASQILSILSSLGTAQASQIVIGQALERNRTYLIWPFVKFAFAVTAMASLVVALLLSMAALAADRWLGKSDLAQVLFGSAILTPLLAISTVRELVARSMGALVLAFGPRDIGWTILLILMLLVSIWVRNHLVVAAAVALALVEVSGWLGLFWGYLRVYRFERARRFVVRPFKRWLNQSFAMMSNAAGGAAFERVDTLIVGALASLSVAGIYSAATRIAPLVAISNRFVYPVLVTRMAGLMAVGRWPDVRHELRNGILASMLFSVPLCAAVFVFAPELVSFVSIKDPVGAAVLRILAVAQLVNACSISFGVIVQAGQKSWLFSRCLWGSLALTLIMVPVAFGSWGPEGSAAAMAAGMIFYSAIFGVIAGRTIIAGEKNQRP